MTGMIALVGEQPMPVLLPSRHLKPSSTLLVCTKKTEDVAKRLSRLIDNAKPALVKSSPYDLARLTAEFVSMMPTGTPLVLNLTGGTKIMSLAAYAQALSTQSNFVYFESEGHSSRLHCFKVSGGLPILDRIDDLPELISAADYLNAHLHGFSEKGFSRENDSTTISEGGRFERAVSDVLESNGYEVLKGVRPQGIKDQIEIDLVIRHNNLVAIAEIKVGDREGKGPKAGLDQLAMAADRKTLGTYTEKFLITARNLTDKSSNIKALAVDRGIHIVELPDYEEGKKLPKSAADKLISTFAEKFRGKSHR